MKWNSYAVYFDVLYNNTLLRRRIRKIEFKKNPKKSKITAKHNYHFKYTKTQTFKKQIKNNFRYLKWEKGKNKNPKIYRYVCFHRNNKNTYTYRHKSSFWNCGGSNNWNINCIKKKTQD